MRQIARFSARRPWPILVVWALVLAAGVAFAGGAHDHLRGTDLRIPGTAADRAADLSERQFGSTISIAVLLEGPPKVLERRGPEIVRRLQRIDGVTVLSPWGLGGARTLREPPGQALLTLQVAKPFQQIADQTTPAVERTLRDAVRAPLRSEMTGLAPLVRGINDATVDAVGRGELIAVPILLVLLLLIFRSPIAALVPAVCGVVVTALGTAVMGLLGRWIALDAIALNIVTMMGLALGVDYSLLIVSRFREELAAGAEPGEALERALARAGRTVLFAGTALVVGMLGALAVAPGGLLVSTTIGAIVATVLAVLAALFLIPAGLAVLGTNVNRWQFAPARASRGAGLSLRLIRKPLLASLAMLPLLVLSAVALGLDTGPPNVQNLPPDNAARQSYEAFQRERGAGWSTPYEITFRSRGPITTRSRLRTIQRFQDRVARRPGVEAVLGPAVLLKRTAALRRIARQATATSELRRLSRGLRRAGDGADDLTSGLGAAAQGSQALVAGLDEAATGSSKLAGGVHRAAPQTERLAAGVKETGDGARRVAEGSREALAGSRELETAVAELSAVLQSESAASDTKLIEPLNRARSGVQSALRGFGSASPQANADPSIKQAKADIQAALADLAILDTNLSSYASELDTNTTAASELASGASKLTRGVEDLTTGTDQLSGGIEQTAVGASTLADQFTSLDSGTTKLSKGLASLLGAQGGGARALSAGLGAAVGGSSELGRGVGRLYDGVIRVRRSNDAQTDALRRSGTDVRKASNSGYFVLAGVEGSSRQTQTDVSFAVNAPNGGTTARVIVVPRDGPFEAASLALRPGLERSTRATARKLHADGVVGGPAVLLDDFDRATTDALPYILLVLVLLTFVVLLAAFRAPWLALIAVLLNVVTVGAAVGVLVLLFQGDDPLLGDAGYLDAIAVSGILGIIFGLSIDYEVFLISRLLEGREETGTTDGAIRYGLERTTTIILGAALIMAGVFLAFAVAPVANIRQFGIGLTVAVLVDATIVRLVLLPALIRLLGERAFAVPRWLAPR